MNAFKNWKLWTIIGSAMTGSAYGLLATLSLNQADLSLWQALVPVVSGAALCASAASALCRIFETWKLIRESQKRPTDHTLCYRGVRYVWLSDREASTAAAEQVGSCVVDEEPLALGIGRQQEWDKIIDSEVCTR